MTRADGRKYNELRPVEITTGFIKFAEGSVLIRCGDTVVLCNASVGRHLRISCSRKCNYVFTGTCDWNGYFYCFIRRVKEAKRSIKCVN